VKYLEDNCGAASIEMSAEEIKAIDDIFPKEAVAGTRYSEGGMKIVNR
jgi:aryl-alcohol dehydrogenase-like predicted oxidoreductase